MATTTTGDTTWGSLGSAAAALMFIYAMFQQYFPYELRGHAHRYTHKLVGFFYPYIQITFHELTGDKLKRSDAYFAIQNYLSAHTTATAKRLKADVVKDSKSSLVLTMDDHEEVVDDLEEGEGGRVWWSSSKNIPKSQGFSFYPKTEERRFYTLTFHKRYREVVTGLYIERVLRQGKSIASKNRQRKLFTNNPSDNWYDYKSTKWSHVQFEHPATFDTLAMASSNKEAIKNDLIKFSKAKDYYTKIGKPWKRGYLLYGPPGTGKSTMIAAMANLLDYDIYDLELTTVKDNSELRKLLIETTSKSIIIIEDIDCSLNLTGQRRKKNKYYSSSSDESSSSSEEDEKKDGGDPVSKKKDEEEKKSKKGGSKVTLSGLLNFIDGIWSGCGGERVIVFTTNFVDKLDPALIRSGRMDKHIEMSYCCFEAFKLLARNYLDMDGGVLFPRIEELLEEVKMTPADVAEHLMPKSEEEDGESCLWRLIHGLEGLKKKSKKKMKKKKSKKEKKDRKGNAEEDGESGESSASSEEIAVKMQ
ncbi:AAA-ATPase ASD, mitochondrial [Linum perenne]